MVEMSSTDVGSWGKKIKQCRHCGALHPIYTTLTGCRVCGESLKDFEIVPNPRILGTSAVETEPEPDHEPDPEPATPEPVVSPPAPEPDPYRALSRLPEWKPPVPEPQEETAPLWRKLTAISIFGTILRIIAFYLAGVLITQLAVTSLTPLLVLYIPSHTSQGAYGEISVVGGIFCAYWFGVQKWRKWRGRK